MNTTTLLLLLIGCTAIVTAGLFFQHVTSKRKANASNNQKAGLFEVRWPYRVKTLMSQPEQVLYYRLTDAFPSYLIFTQVSLSRVLTVKKGRNPLPWYNKLSKMSLDFVICSPDANILLAVELDDATHRRPERTRADKTKDRAMRSANVLLVRYPITAIPDAAILRALLDAPENKPSLLDEETEAMPSQTTLDDPVKEHNFDPSFTPPDKAPAQVFPQNQPPPWRIPDPHTAGSISTATTPRTEPATQKPSWR